MAIIHLCPFADKTVWAIANQKERKKLLLTMLDAVYVDAKKTKSIVAIRPKPPFKPVFQVAASREGSDIRILNEPLNGSSMFLVETGEGACLKSRSHVVESGQRVGGEPDATAAIES
jgi:hypothetical protein